MSDELIKISRNEYLTMTYNISDLKKEITILKETNILLNSEIDHNEHLYKKENERLKDVMNNISVEAAKWDVSVSVIIDLLKTISHIIKH